jgi:hypothetical protein
MPIWLPVFGIILLLVAVSPAEAVNCDCNRKISRCSASAKFLKPDVVEFRSGSQCSFIFYRLNGLAYYTTIINGVEILDYLRNPAQTTVPTVSVESCDVCIDLDAEKTTDTTPSDAVGKKATEANKPQKRPDPSAASKQTFTCPARLTYLPDDGTMETAWRNQLMNSCKATYPDIYADKAETPPIKTKEQLAASKRAHLAKIQEAKEKHAREEEEQEQARRQLRAQEEVQYQRQQHIWSSIVNAVGAGAATYGAAAPMYQKRKVLPPPKTYSAPSNTLKPGTMPKQATTPTGSSRSTCDQPGCAIREVP